MREALAFARHVLLPRFQDAATERAFITERFSATYGATMTYFLILAFLTCLALPFAEGLLGRCRLGTLMIGYVFVLVARYQHRPSRFPDQYLASLSFATCAASFCLLAIPLAKFMFPQPTLAPHFIAGMHFLSIIVVRHHNYPTTQRLAIHFGIFLADLEGSRLLTGSALAAGELVGSTSLRTICGTISPWLSDGLTAGRKQLQRGMAASGMAARGVTAASMMMRSS